MKKIVISVVLTGIIASIVVLSCKKTSSPSSSYIGPSLNSLFSGLRYTPQGLSVTVGRDTIVYGANGTMLHFYTNSFKDANNNIITSGTVYLQLVEMYKPGDMICNRASTMANGQILQSGGQVSINATINGQTVYANAYGIGFKHSTSSTAPMALFYGATGNADSVVTWTQSDTTHVGMIATGTVTDSSIGSGGGSTNANFFYFDTCTNFTFANCDWFYKLDSTETGVSVSVILPDTSFNPNNTQLFLVIPNVPQYGLLGRDTVVAVLTSDYGGSAYTLATNTMSITNEGQSNIVPTGLNYELVVISNKNGSWYYWETSGVVPHNGILVTAAPAVETQGDIVARLQGL